MNPLIVSARYAAYTWFLSRKENADKSQEEAQQFAQQHWENFLPLANEGWGRLLIKICRRKKKAVRERQAAEHARATIPAMPEAPPAYLGYQWIGQDM